MSDVHTQTLEGLAAGDGISEMKGKFLTFWTDQQLFGVPIADVVQIVGMQNVTEIPEFPSFAKGIINLRGSIIPVIDVRLRFGKPEKEYDERTCIIVTNIDDALMGFVVDSVDSVTDIDDERISPPPKLSGGQERDYLTGIAKLENTVVLLISTTKLLGSDELAVITNAIVEES